MKKTLCLFGATIIASVAITSCSKEEVSELPKNYYGTQPASNGTPKEAYYAFFGGILVIVFIVLWLLKKAGVKK